MINRDGPIDGGSMLPSVVIQYITFADGTVLTTGEPVSIDADTYANLAEAVSSNPSSTVFTMTLTPGNSPFTVPPRNGFELAINSAFGFMTLLQGVHYTNNNNLCSVEHTTATTLTVRIAYSN